jgi:hypothetical protein
MPGLAENESGHQDCWLSIVVTEGNVSRRNGRPIHRKDGMVEALW